MRRHTFQVLLLATWSALPMAHAQETEDLARTAVPVKGSIEATGSVELVITLYDREKGGNELYSVTSTVPVEGNTYFGMIDVPDEVFRGKSTVFVEVAKPSTPAIALEARAPFTKPGGKPARGTQKSLIILGCSLCYSCGGSYPIFSGAFRTPILGPGTAERGKSCSGSVASRPDIRPHLCCQNVSL